MGINKKRGCVWILTQPLFLLYVISRWRLWGRLPLQWVGLADIYYNSVYYNALIFDTLELHNFYKPSWIQSNGRCFWMIYNFSKNTFYGVKFDSLSKKYTLNYDFWWTKGESEVWVNKKQPSWLDWLTRLFCIWEKCFVQCRVILLVG